MGRAGGCHASPGPAARPWTVQQSEGLGGGLGGGAATAGSRAAACLARWIPKGV